MLSSYSMKTKLLLICGALTLVVVSVGFVGYAALRSVAGDYSWVVSNSVPKIELSDEMFLNYRRVRITLRTLGLEGISQEDAELAIRETQAAIDSYEAASHKYLSLPLIPGEKELNDKVEEAWRAFKATGVQVISLYRSGSPDDRKKMIDIFFTECPARAKVFTEAVNAVVSFHRKVGDELIHKSHERSQFATMALLVIVMLGTVLCTILGLIFSDRVARALNAVVQSLTDGASQMSAEVSQLTHSSGDLFSAAKRQAEALEETSASMEEIRAMVEKNTQNAASSAEGSEQSKTKAENGQRVVKEVIHSMTDIEEGNQQIISEVIENNRRITEVVHVIQEISNKTKVIDDIVFQTKLLSFNASVEAARAGEQGKGFAVVAEEVGNLARMSGNASREIADMLEASVQKVEGIARETQGRIEGLIKKAQVKIERGNKVAMDCDLVLGEIVRNAWSVSEMVNEISSASKEQSAGVVEIAKAIHELDATTRTNTSAAQLTAASASTINEQLRALKDASTSLRGLILGIDKAVSVSRFIWSDRFALGIDAMDDEHKILIEKINHLAQELEACNGNAERLMAPFRDLASYTRKHFSDEEAYMKSIGYADLEKHKVIHASLLAGVKAFGNDLEAGKLDGEKLISFLNDWLIRHILGVDMKYASYAKDQSPLAA